MKSSISKRWMSHDVLMCGGWALTSSLRHQKPTLSRCNSLLNNHLYLGAAIPTNKHIYPSIVACTYLLVLTPPQRKRPIRGLSARAAQCSQLSLASSNRLSLIPSQLPSYTPTTLPAGNNPFLIRILLLPSSLPLEQH